MGPNRCRGMQHEFGKDLLPEFGDVILDQRHRHQSRGDHLQHVLVGQYFRCRPDAHRRLAGGGELGIEALDDALRGIRGTQVKLASREFQHARERRTAWPGDRDDRDSGSRRVGEVDLLAAPVGDQRPCGNDVAAAFEERGDQLVVRDGHEDDLHAQMLVLELLVEIVLEQLEGVRYQAARRALVDEE